MTTPRAGLYASIERTLDALDANRQRYPQLYAVGVKDEDIVLDAVQEWLEMDLMDLLRTVRRDTGRLVPADA